MKDILIAHLNKKSYRIRNLIANIIAQIITYDFPNCLDGFLEKICDSLGEDNIIQIDCALRILILVLKPEEKYHTIVNKVLENLFSAFTNPDSDSKIREKCLQIYYQCLRCVSWADGIDEKVITDALDDSFNQWMALMIQLIQSNPKVHFEIKKNALKCLTIIFRDMVNYSIE